MTPAQIRFCFWANVIHGAKGIAWFHYFGGTPSDNKKEMARCLDEVTRLTGVILGAPYAGQVTKKETGARTDFMVRQDETAVYLFAANVKESAGKVTFTLDFAPTKIEVVDEGRTLKADGDERSFSDDFDPLGVHIYKLSK
jgi:hypothetical protein